MTVKDRLPDSSGGVFCGLPIAHSEGSLIPNEAGRTRDGVLNSFPHQIHSESVPSYLFRVPEIDVVLKAIWLLCAAVWCERETR